MDHKKEGRYVDHTTIDPAAMPDLYVLSPLPREIREKLTTAEWKFVVGTLTVNLWMRSVNSGREERESAIEQTPRKMPTRLYIKMEENWDGMEEESYDPIPYCTANRIIRTPVPLPRRLRKT